MADDFGHHPPQAGGAGKKHAAAIVEAAAKLTPVHIVALSFATVVLGAISKDDDSPEYLRYLLQDLLHALEMLRKRPTADAARFFKTFLRDGDAASHDLARAMLEDLSQLDSVYSVEAFIADKVCFLQEESHNFRVHECSELGVFLHNINVSSRQCGFVAMLALEEGAKTMIAALREYLEHDVAHAVFALKRARSRQQAVFQRVLADQFVELLELESDRTPLSPPGARHHMKRFISATRRGDILAAQEQLLLHYEVERNRDWIITQTTHSESQLALAYLHYTFGHHALAAQAVHDAIGTALELAQTPRLRQALGWLAEMAPTPKAAMALSRANLQHTRDQQAQESDDGDDKAAMSAAAFGAHVQLALCSFAAGDAAASYAREVQAAMGVALGEEASWHSYTCTLHLMGAFAAAVGDTIAACHHQAAVVFSAAPPPEHADADALAQAQLILVLARKHGRYAFAASQLAKLAAEMQTTTTTKSPASPSSSSSSSSSPSSSPPPPTADDGGDDGDDDDDDGGENNPKPQQQEGRHQAQQHASRVRPSADSRAVGSDGGVARDHDRVLFYHHLALHWKHVPAGNFEAAKAAEAGMCVCTMDACDDLACTLRIAERALAEGEMEACLKHCAAALRLNSSDACRHVQTHKLQGPIAEIEAYTLMGRCYLKTGNTERAMAVLSHGAALAVSRRLIGPLVALQTVFMQCLVQAKRWSLFAEMEKNININACMCASFETRAELLLVRGFYHLAIHNDATTASGLLKKSYAMYMRIGHTRNQRRCLHLLSLCAHVRGDASERDALAQQMNALK
ncbi:hypothetical protein PTSG_10369 [Salpingoeca rosetta]|uniref:Anaphase-promoting complex subunit 5 domain-containing protein n=1 Tax=Salpingoeca rosetta (strain ATCC 50818 / BSB-021) TaxID=946362 RepID=F2UR40_SALR5|nr:uncharacterized protein PTSG_10369 [Salpingoeca rosetta]EGD80095.1 hypothetical protein PTSG_10369 [Salpingoeca rosetta]|eukprot:XP_004988420.1 hypothetical protein PTSG_10369 [Salpingoeca rosetta]